MAVFSGFKVEGHSFLKQYWDRHLEKAFTDLKNLLGASVLTQEEFDTEKTKVLMGEYAEIANISDIFTL
jgi:predicted Zn-dependent peptidase